MEERADGLVIPSVDEVEIAREHCNRSCPVAHRYITDAEYRIRTAKRQNNKPLQCQFEKIILLFDQFLSIWMFEMFSGYGTDSDDVIVALHSAAFSQTTWIDLLYLQWTGEILAA